MIGGGILVKLIDASILENSRGGRTSAIEDVNNNNNQLSCLSLIDGIRDALKFYC